MATQAARQFGLTKRSTLEIQAICASGPMRMFPSKETAREWMLAEINRPECWPMIRFIEA
jgi:hypothetical protein